MSPPPVSEPFSFPVEVVSLPQSSDIKREDNAFPPKSLDLLPVPRPDESSKTLLPDKASVIPSPSSLSVDPLQEKKDISDLPVSLSDHLTKSLSNKQYSKPLSDQKELPQAVSLPSIDKSPDSLVQDRTKKENSESLEKKIENLLEKSKKSVDEKNPSTDLDKPIAEGLEAGGKELSLNEMDALRRQIQLCWNVPVGAANAGGLIVSIRFRLNRSGEVEGMPQILSAGGSGIQQAAAESARRAILQCAPYRLPADKYESWAEVTVNFDPRDMF